MPQTKWKVESRTRRIDENESLIVVVLTLLKLMRKTAARVENIKNNAVDRHRHFIDSNLRGPS
ncbi:MAG: hypothetical protein AB7D27_12910 [Desulfomicrobium sp.]